MNELMAGTIFAISESPVLIKRKRTADSSINWDSCSKGINIKPILYDEECFSHVASGGNA